jgi:uncharacterized protein (UPF0335 family)
MTLQKLEIENFRGFKKQTIDFGDRRTVISAAIGVGKTNVYDAFLWLFFGKDSTGRTDSGVGHFELRPLDENSRPIEGLVVHVAGTLSMDGDEHVLVRESHENRVRKELRGYETQCWIDGVPKKVGEYEEFVDSLISETDFKLLTDLHYFCGKMGWLERRKTLMRLAGDIRRPSGFDDLMAKLNNRTIKEYQAALLIQAKRHRKEREEIPPRIDELQRGLPGYADVTDTKKVARQRDDLNKKLEALSTERSNLLKKETERQKQIEALNNLKARKADREAYLRSDTAGMQALRDERLKIESQVDEKRHDVVLANSAVELKQGDITGKKLELGVSKRLVEDIKQQHQQLDRTIDGASKHCPTCTCRPSEKEKQKRVEQLNLINERGAYAMQRVRDQKDEIERLEEELAMLQDELTDAKKMLADAETDAKKRLDRIIADIRSAKPLPFEEDSAWQSLCRQIAEAEEQVGEPVTKQLDRIEATHRDMAGQILQLNKVLAQADRMRQDAERIKELQDREKELSQYIADIDADLAEIDRYNLAECSLIESAVNGKFSHIKFVMFRRLLNGEIQECCEPTLNGVPYLDMSTGQQIRSGLDIVSVLAADRGVSVPLFVDHSESYTEPIEAPGQVIELQTVRGVSALQIEKFNAKETENGRKTSKKTIG